MAGYLPRIVARVENACFPIPLYSSRLKGAPVDTRGRHSSLDTWQRVAPFSGFEQLAKFICRKVCSLKAARRVHRSIISSPLPFAVARWNNATLPTADKVATGYFVFFLLFSSLSLPFFHRHSHFSPGFSENGWCAYRVGNVFFFFSLCRAFPPPVFSLSTLSNWYLSSRFFVADPASCTLVYFGMYVSRSLCSPANELNSKNEHSSPLSAVRFVEHFSSSSLFFSRLGNLFDFSQQFLRWSIFWQSSCDSLS